MATSAEALLDGDGLRNPRVDVGDPVRLGLRRRMFLAQHELEDLSALLTCMHATVCHEGCTNACELLADISQQRVQTLSALGELLELLGPPGTAMFDRAHLAHPPALRASIGDVHVRQLLARVTAEPARHHAVEAPAVGRSTTGAATRAP